MYACPMHPEVRADVPRLCPKCGMRLVEEKLDPVSVSATPAVHDDRGLGPLTWRSYLPLIVIFSILFLSTAVLGWCDHIHGSFLISSLALYFMTGFFLVFSAFKLMDLKGFAEGYATYDILAQRLRSWGYIYPFLELFFGIAMLSGNQDFQLLWIEFFIMVFGGIGVLVKKRRREPVVCACLGTFLKVPLTNITLIENFGMAALAMIAMIARAYGI